MDIVVDVFDSERISGWIRGTAEPQTLQLSFGGEVRKVRAEDARADLQASTAFAYRFDDATRNWLHRGEALSIALGGEATQRMEMRLNSGAPKPIAFAIPAGMTSRRDEVSWYDADDVAKNFFHYHNIGDSFVYDSSLKILNFQDSLALNVAGSANAPSPWLMKSVAPSSSAGRTTSTRTWIGSARRSCSAISLCRSFASALACKFPTAGLWHLPATKFACCTYWPTGRRQSEFVAHGRPKSSASSGSKTSRS